MRFFGRRVAFALERAEEAWRRRAWHVAGLISWPCSLSHFANLDILQLEKAIDAEDYFFLYARKRR